MTDEVFADPVMVPGPHVRSLFTDTEGVDEDTAALVEDDEELRWPLGVLVRSRDGESNPGPIHYE